MASISTGKREPDLQSLLDRLKDPEPTRRLTAVVILGNLGPRARTAVPALLQALKDRAAEIRRLAIAALIQVGPDPATVSAMITLLRDPEPRVRRRAIYGLGELGSAGRTAAPALIALLRDPDDLVRRLAAASLGEIGPTAPTAIPALIESLGEDDMKNRAVSQAALTKMGARAVPRLIDALRHPDARVRRYAARVLSRSERGRDALPELHLLLHDTDPHVREAARAALGTLQN